MRTGLARHCAIAATMLLLMLPAAASANDGFNSSTPFDGYVRVSEKIYVYDKTLLKPYTGPDVSHWERVYTEEPDDPAYDRKRLGIITITPTLHVYADVLSDPLTEYYEFRDVKTNKVVLWYRYYEGFTGVMLFNGQGSMYVYDRPDALCTPGRVTTKYQLKNGKMVLVPQPFLAFDNVTATTSKDTKLLRSPKVSSAVVASLLSGTAVTVLTEEGNWLLIKTPLGLTGWVQGGADGSLPQLYNCKE